MHRHYPWNERECFIASGSSFFPAARTLELAEALAEGPPYQGYKYRFEDAFLGSTIVQTTNRDEVMLRVWEPPEPNGVYVIGGDPSGGGGGDANDHAIEVFRCYADRLVQVAEFHSNKPLTYQFAWVLSHLCGAYRDHVANIEVSGVGAAVIPEVRNLRQLAQRGIIQAEAGSDSILNMVGSVRWFLYNQDNKQAVYSALRDSLMLRAIELRSIRLVKELQAIVEDEGWLGAGPDTGENDDLVSATTLAHHTWVEWRRAGLIARNLTWDSVKGDPPPANAGTVLSFAFSEHIRAINARAGRRKEVF
jgi:hypothetical protein